MGRNWQDVAVRGVGGGVGVLGVLLAVGCQDGPFLQTEQYVTRDGQPEEKVGTACISVEKGNGMGGGRAPGVPGAAGDGSADAAGSYSFSYEGTGSGVRFQVVASDGTLLADKNYDGPFIDSGRKDEVKIVADGETARFVASGIAQCGQTP
jgi:hypothetical protein